MAGNFGAVHPQLFASYLNNFRHKQKPLFQFEGFRSHRRLLT